MNRPTSILLFLVLHVTSIAQSISREEANSLIRSLGKSKEDTAGINLRLKIAKFHVFKAGEYKADLDSASLLINQAEKINAAIKSTMESGNILLVKSYYLKESGQKELAKETIGRAIQILKNEKNKDLLGEAFFESSFYYSNDDNAIEFNKRIELVRQAVQCFEESGSVALKASSLKMLGDLLEQADKPEEALAALKYSLQSYQSIHYEPVQGIHILIGSTYKELGDMSEALKHSLLALQVAEKVKDTSIQLCEINNKVGLIFFSLKEYEKASAYFASALITAEKYNDSASIFQITTNLLTTYGLLNKPGEGKKVLENVSEKYKNPGYVYDDILLSIAAIGIYDQLKEFKTAQYFCDRLLRISEPYDLTTNEWANVYTSVIKFYVATKQYALAQNYLHRAESLKDLGLLSKMTINGAGFTLDTARKDYKSATIHLLAYKSLNDSIFSEKKSNEIQRLQIQFATTKRESEFKLLSQQGQIQRAELKQSKFIRNIIIAGAGLLTIIMSLLFYQFKLKQRSNTAIQKQNSVLQHMVHEKEWLLKEVHHRVKNNLQTVVSLLELQAQYLQNDALSAIHDSQNRIYAMSLIHQKLYQSENISSINMQSYLQEFIDHLREIYNTGRKINISIRVLPIELDVSQAIPIGLIVNEAVTNSIKYAFNDAGDDIKTLIALQENTKGQLELTIADNGIGLPPDFENTDSNGLGFKLMKGLASDIDGHLTIESNKGTLIKVCFNASVPFYTINQEAG